MYRVGTFAVKVMRGIPMTARIVGNIQSCDIAKMGVE